MVLAAVATGFLLWVAAQFDTGTTGGYWAALALIAFGGLLLGLSQHRGGESSPRWVRVLVFLPASLVALWAIVVRSPKPTPIAITWWRGTPTSESPARSRALGLWNGVLALGVGLLVGPCARAELRVFAATLRPPGAGSRHRRFSSRTAGSPTSPSSRSASPPA